MTKPNAPQRPVPPTPRPGSAQLPPRRTPRPQVTPPPRAYHRPPAVVSAKTVGSLPDFIIIGATACETARLYESLSYHPSIGTPRRKELNFFVHHQNWPRGLGWYRSHFPDAKVVGEASPNYTHYPLFAGVPERMHMVVPHAKLIFCVRDPVERAVAHYLHAYALGRENRPLEVALRQRDNNPYLLCSRFYYQLEQYLRFYDPLQIKLVVLEELRANPLETMRDVFYFLGVDPSYEDSRFERAAARSPAAPRRSPLKSWLVRKNIQGYDPVERLLPWVFGPPVQVPELSAELRGRLCEHLGADVAALRKFSGLNLGAWQL